MTLVVVGSGRSLNLVGVSLPSGPGAIAAVRAGAGPGRVLRASRTSGRANAPGCGRRGLDHARPRASQRGPGCSPYAATSYAYERMAMFTSAKHNWPGRKSGTRYHYAWYRRVGVHRLSGTITEAGAYPTVDDVGKPCAGEP